MCLLAGPQLGRGIGSALFSWVGNDSDGLALVHRFFFGVPSEYKLESVVNFSDQARFNADLILQHQMTIS